MRRDTSRGIPPHGLAHKPDLQISALMVEFDRLQEEVPVPRTIEAELSQRSLEVGGHETLDEFLERFIEIREWRDVIDRGPGESEE